MSLFSTISKIWAKDGSAQIQDALREIDAIMEAPRSLWDWERHVFKHAAKYSWPQAMTIFSDDLTGQDSYATWGRSNLPRIAVLAHVAGEEAYVQRVSWTQQRYAKQVQALVTWIDGIWPRLQPQFRKAKSLGINKYGDQDFELFHDEADELLNYARQRIDLDLIHDDGCGGIAGTYILHRLHEAEDQEAALGEIPDNGYDFEIWCAEAIQRQGWQIQPTPKSGDQGVDILATRAGISVAIQCKRYAAATGNAAVQQVIAGRSFVGATHAMVIATGGFTKSAKELAAVTGVKLCDAQDIALFSAMFGLDSIEAEFDDEAFSDGYDDDFRTVLVEVTTQAQADLFRVISASLGDMSPDLREWLQDFLIKLDPGTGSGRAEMMVGTARALLQQADDTLMEYLTIDDALRQQMRNREEYHEAFLEFEDGMTLRRYHLYHPERLVAILGAMTAYIVDLELVGFHPMVLDDLDEEQDN